MQRRWARSSQAVAAEVVQQMVEQLTGIRVKGQDVAEAVQLIGCDERQSNGEGDRMDKGLK